MDETNQGPGRAENTTIHLYGAKGGVGTSTVAALVALDLQRQGHSVALQDAGGDHADLRALLGLAPVGAEYPTLGSGPTTVNVIDHGTSGPAPLGGEAVYLVIRACYLALARALRSNVRPDGIVLVAEPGRSLGVRDIQEVLGVRVVAEVPVMASMARSIDAGRLPTAPREVRQSVRALTEGCVDCRPT
jgi:hypothetical protein